MSLGLGAIITISIEDLPNISSSKVSIVVVAMMIDFLDASVGKGIRLERWEMIGDVGPRACLYLELEIIFEQVEGLSISSYCFKVRITQNCHLPKLLSHLDNAI